MTPPLLLRHDWRSTLLVHGAAAPARVDVVPMAVVPIHLHAVLTTTSIVRLATLPCRVLPSRAIDPQPVVWPWPVAAAVTARADPHCLVAGNTTHMIALLLVHDGRHVPAPCHRLLLVSLEVRLLIVELVLEAVQCVLALRLCRFHGPVRCFLLLEQWLHLTIAYLHERCQRRATVEAHRDSSIDLGLQRLVLLRNQKHRQLRCARVQPMQDLSEPLRGVLIPSRLPSYCLREHP